jgi:lipopolysaccharide heptosyltransferase I
VNKLQTLAQLQNILAEAKKKGRRVVLANGCFDLIHAGHIRYLQGAKEKGDILVLALNSDQSVTSLKGPGRPILSQEERAEILGSFSFVDYLVIFNEPNVEKLLEALKPDVHAKGSDYTEETVPEKETARQIGAAVAIAGGPKIRNTRDIIRDIAEGAPAEGGRADKGPPEAQPAEEYLFIRLSSLGDIIHTLPAFSALRRHRPQARITWAVARPGKAILDLVPGLDCVLVLDRGCWLRQLRTAKRKDFIALDFQGLVKSGLIAFLSGARRRIGFERRNLREPLARLFYTETMSHVPETGHVVSKNLQLLTRLGIWEPTYDFPLIIPLEAAASVRSALAGLGFRKEEGRKLVVCNVGAAWETKRWFPDRWAAFLARMKADDRFLLLLWGNKHEQRLAEEVGRRSGVRLTPFLNIVEVMALLKESDLLVSGDTFALQAACALAVPVVGLFGPTNPQRNGPFSEKDSVVYHQLPCSACYRRTCSNPKCMKLVQVEEVVKAAEGRLRSAGRA